MRKFLAALLAVMMIAGVLAAMPVSAADEIAQSKFDGTKANEAMNGLIITEILVNSKAGTDRDDQPSGESAAVFSSPDAMDFIEVYNAGEQPVNLFDYVILSAPYRDFTGESKSSGSNTQTVPYKFTYMNTIKTGDIHSTSNGAKADTKTYDNSCANYQDYNMGYIAPGEIAVIWYWTSATDTACSDKGYSLGRTAEDGRTFAYFRDYYGMDSETKIFATNAKVSNTQTDQFHSLEYNYVYALADKSYDFSGTAITETKDQHNNVTKTLNGKIKCMASYTTYNGVGIVNTQNMDGVSAYYVPAACTPDLINQNAKKVAELEDKLAEYKDKADYVEAECALSYRETAIISFTEEATPGGMPSWQWQYIQKNSNTDHRPDDVPAVYGYGLAYIEQNVWSRVEAKMVEMLDPANHDKELKGITGVGKQLKGNKNLAEADQPALKMDLYGKLMETYVSDWRDANGDVANASLRDANGRLDVSKTGETYNWVAKANTYMTTYFAASINENAQTGYQEAKKDYAAGFVDREEQYNKWFGSKLTGGDGEGLPIWLLIAIIGGGVVLVAAIVVVVIVIAKKKKPVAADDVAAEGEILVIDETANAEEAPVEEAAAEAPVEEAPVEEAPAEEEKTEE